MRVWAVSVDAVNAEFGRVVDKAKECASAKDKHDMRISTRVAVSPDTLGNYRDYLLSNSVEMRQRTEQVLAAGGKFRAELKRSGCVGIVSPPFLNARLANQQGLFLFNGAQDLPLPQSLEKMMRNRKDWCVAYDVPVSLRTEIQRQLLKMNIHEQILFPDIEGLAGWLKQKIELEWS